MNRADHAGNPLHMALDHAEDEEILATHFDLMGTEEGLVVGDFNGLNSHSLAYLQRFFHSPYTPMTC